jgi:hypothetical protein
VVVGPGSVCEQQEDGFPAHPTFVVGWLGNHEPQQALKGHGLGRAANAAMKTAFIWSRRILLAMLILLSIAWTFGEASQWLFRYRAERLLAEFQALEVNRSSQSEAQALLQRWSRYGMIVSRCDGDLCRSSFEIRQFLPEVFRVAPTEGTLNLLPRLVDHIGLRNEGVGIGFTTEQGIVTRKEFGLIVALPVADWYLRGGAYVPDLNIWAGEAAKFSDYEERLVQPPHPFRIVRNQKGPYGVLVTFRPEEDASEQAALMNFQFSCLTKLFPCRSEGDILPKAWEMLQERQ